MKNLRQIKRSVCSTFQKYREKLGYSVRAIQPEVRRPYDKIPEIGTTMREGKSYAVIHDALVGVYCEDSYALPFAHIAKECSRKYDGKIFLEVVKPERKTASCRSIMDMMVLELTRGSLVDILFEDDPKNPDENAKKEIIRLYAGITTMSERPDFDRLNPCLKK